MHNILYFYTIEFGAGPDEGGVQRAGGVGRGLQRVHPDQEVPRLLPAGLILINFIYFIYL